MENVNKAIVRGVGNVDVVWDCSAFATPINLLTTDEVLVRIENSNVCMLLKRNQNVIHGSDDELEVDADNDEITMHLTAVERNTAIPDSGYTYKLFINNEMAAYGTFTASGDAPSEYEEPVESTDGYAQEKHCYSGQTLKSVQELITDAASNKRYLIKFYPGATIGTGWIANPYIHVEFLGNSSRNLDFEDADLSNGIHILSGLDVTGADFSSATLPTEISSKPTEEQKKIAFKDTVGKFSGTTTMWTDGEAIS